MSLPNPPDKYDRAEQMKVRAQIDRLDKQNRKRGQDVEIAGGERLILPDTVTGDRYSLTIASGAIVLSLLP
jgi:hypothetical protein